MRAYRPAIEMLTDQQLAKLFVHLQVPVAVQAVLDGQQALDDEARYTLSDMIAAQTPDQALLSIALCSLLLDARLRDGGERCAEILAMSSEMMVQDYAPLYLEQLGTKKNATLFDRDDLEFLATIPEDLESIADLLAVVADVVPATQSLVRDVAHILAAQAQAQALIAETITEKFDDDATMDAIEAAISAADNVVPFKKR